MLSGKGELLLLQVVVLPPAHPSAGTETSLSTPKPRGRVQPAPPCAAGCVCASRRKSRSTVKTTPRLKLTFTNVVTWTNRQTSHWRMDHSNCTGAVPVFCTTARSCLVASCGVAGVRRSPWLSVFLQPALEGGLLQGMEGFVHGDFAHVPTASGVGSSVPAPPSWLKNKKQTNQPKRPKKAFLAARCDALLPSVCA